MSAEVGPSISYQGIPYYLSQMNEWVRKFSTAFNGILRQGVQDDGKQGIDLFTGDNVVTGKELDFTVPLTGTGTVTVKNTDDSYYQLTAGNFTIADDLLKDASKLATRTEQHSGVSDNDIVTKLIDLKTNSKVMSFRGCSADQYLVCMLSDVSLNTQRASDFTTSYTVQKTSIENQRLGVSGVDNDEEAVNLTKYQQQYNLASKMISVLAEVYDRLIRETGV
jgi:flagellar hook-associated protein 1 FlgK